MTINRVLLAVAASLVFLFMIVLRVTDRFDSYDQILKWWGILPYRVPFIDIGGWLAAWECTRRGIDVIVEDPCDLLGRGFASSPLWLSASVIPLGVSSMNAVGLILDALFLASLALLPPARSGWGLVVMLLASLSTMVVFALERANADVIIFLMAVGAGLLALRALSARLVGYAIALIAAALKYYPITLMILFSRERWSTFVATTLTAIGLIGLFVGTYLPALERGVPLIATGSYYFDLFSAKTLPFALADLLQHPGSASLAPGSAASNLGIGLYSILVLLGVIVAWLSLKTGRLGEALRRMARDEHIFLVIGSAIMVGCFFGAQNTSYRGIFLLLTLPGFLALSRTATGGRVGALGGILAATIVFLMWGECIRQNLLSAHDAPGAAKGAITTMLVIFWFLRELAWWWVVSVMAAVLVEFVWGSEVVRPLRAVMARRTASVRET